MSTDMVLVCMPFAELPRPPLAPGLLAALLNREGLRCETLHANLLFAEAIGLQDWQQLFIPPMHCFVPDYLFSQIAFPEHAVGVDDFIDALEGKHWSVRELRTRKFDQLLRRVRSKAGEFIEELAREILAKNPLVVGCSSTFVQQVPSLALLRHIKETSPHTLTMLGGANCEMEMGETIHRQCPWVDVVVSGEPEAVLPQLVRQLQEQGRGIPITGLPPGIFAPGHRDGDYPQPPQRLSFRALDTLPTPDFTEYFATLERCRSLKDRLYAALTAESSRGCWWGQQQGCTFCGLNSKEARYAAKSPHKFLDELSELYRRYGISRFSIADNILSPGYFTSFLPLLAAAGKPFRLFLETRSNLNRLHFEALRQAGIDWIQPGIESLSTGLLHHMKKGTRAWEHVRILKLALEYGIRMQWFILHDFPGEQDEWFAEMQVLTPLLQHLQPPVNMISVQYCRFSELFAQAEQHGLDLVVPGMARLVYPFPDAALRQSMSFLEPRGGRPSDSGIRSLLTELPAKRLLRAVIAEWIVAFTGTRPVLELTDDGSTLTIRDTRAVAVQATHLLQGALRDVYLQACEAYPKLDDLGAQGDDLAYLVDNRLAVRLDGRLVGLAVPKPLYQLPLRTEYPGGFVQYGSGGGDQ